MPLQEGMSTCMNKKVIKFMLGLLKSYRKRMAVVLICMIVVSAFGAIYPLFQRAIFDDGIMAGDFRAVIYFTGLILGLFLIEQLFSFIQFINYEYINRQIPFELMGKVVEHSIQLKMSYHKDNNFIKIIDNVNNDMASITQVVNASLLQAVVSLFKIIGGIIGLAFIDWRLTIFILAIIPLEVFTKSRFAARQQRHFNISLKLQEKFSMWFGETFKSIEVIKLWNLQKKRTDEFDRFKKDLMQINAKMEYENNYSNVSSVTLGTIFNHGLNLLGAMFILRGELTIGGLFAFAAYSAYVMQPVALLADISYRFSSSLPSFTRFMDYFDNDIECQEGSSTVGAFTKVESLSFENVKFAYNDKKTILESIDFSIHLGEKIAFVGANGSGKSSIVNLILRFYEPKSGSIKINGIDIQQIALKEYRELIGVMNQDITLFDDSIKNNINVLGDLSELQVQDYLEKATGSELIYSLPDGFETGVGFNGSKLSGGEKQKISLARTLAKKCRIMILDEATASFDSKAEERFNNYIFESTQYDIIIVISHRENILKGLDKIFMIDNGVIIDSGTFSELLIRNDYFKKVLAQEGTTTRGR